MIEVTNDAAGKPYSNPRLNVYKTQALRGGGALVAIPKFHGKPSEPAKTALATAILKISKFDSQLEEQSFAVKGYRMTQPEADSFRATGRGALTAEVQQAKQVVAHHRAETAKTRTKIVTVPPVTDVITALRDNEIRTAMRALNPEQTARYFAEINAGQHPEALHALARDPTPFSVMGDAARATYESQQKQLMELELHELDQEDEGHEGISAALAVLEETLTAPAATAGTQVGQNFMANA